MFTGIIECVGTVTEIRESGSNKSFWISTAISDTLKPDQSISHSGVCLTVEEVNSCQHRVTAIDETLQKTNLGLLRVGDEMNIERCMQMNGRMDGHIVQGHVDATAICTKLVEKPGSREYAFEFDEKFAGLVIEKGSISLNGISLTVFNVTKNNFTVAIIPYTFEHTNIKRVEVGSTVNVEFDILGKYVQRMLELRTLDQDQSQSSFLK